MNFARVNYILGLLKLREDPQLVELKYRNISRT